MNSEIFNIDSFNIVEDEENYYFFRALNMADNADVEQGITTSKTGEIERIRTDRARYEGEAKYSEESKISLEEVFDHIKMHYRKDTNCISLTSNGNVAVNYGRGSYKDRYVMIRVPKTDVGASVVVAGQYMLEEISKRIEEAVERVEGEKKSKIDTYMGEIDRAERNETLEEIVERRYSLGKGRIEEGRGKLRRGITYRRPVSQMSNYQSLGREQILEINKIYAKMAILEREGIEEHIIEHTANSKVRETVGSAFSSMELIHYGEIKKENIIEIPKEAIDIFSLIQQMQELMPKLEYEKLEKLKREIIEVIKNGIQIRSIREIEENIKKSISIEEMYELTEGRVEYGKATSIVNSMYYLSKARKNAIELSNVLRGIFGNNSEYEATIRYIEDNGFRVEPEIISRQSGNGIKLSESVSLNLPKEEQRLVEDIKRLSQRELEEVLQSRGMLNIQEIITRTYGNESEKISRERYYAEAIISQYNWKKIGIEEFKAEEKVELVKRLQEKNCIEIYNKLKEAGIEEKLISTYVLNITMKQKVYEQFINGNFEELLNQMKDILQNNIDLETIERFLGYYDVEGTEIKLKSYQQRALNRVNEIFTNHKYAQVVLPTGAGKSFVALAQMQKYATEHPNVKMLFLAPQEEILNQVKSYIVKYIHGKKETVGKSVGKIIEEVFPNITFESYPGLLARRGKKIIKEQYGMIVLDELHRTGAKEWEGRIDTLLENQTDEVKVLGITATPIRDKDGRDMVKATAMKLGYTEEEIKKRKHMAANITLENAIRMGYVVNPKLVYCKYDLISSKKMEELRIAIEGIMDNTEREEKLQRYNELRTRLNTEIDAEIGEEARKKLETLDSSLNGGIGKEEILRENVKRGGKYIVFIPSTEQWEMEGENGSKIGTKVGEEKLKAYQDYLKKVFDGTDIVPQCYAMSGAWNEREKNKLGEDKNQQALRAFELDNSDRTKFMVVVNKANEGLHIEGVDGIIWLRALDEDSRILYLQQLGRVIYALDESNIIRDEDRPIVIDLTNNSLTVKMEKIFEKTEPIDDLEMLTIIKEWIDEHNGILPDGNSSNKQEQHYYSVLRKIQSKYSKYLNGFDNFEKLSDEEKEEIQEIINLATQFDLWNIDLPSISKNKYSTIDINPFEISGIIRDYVEMKNDVDEIEKRSTYEQVIAFLEAHDGEMMQGHFCANGKSLKKGEMTIEQQRERNLYARWRNSNERKVLDDYEGRTIEDVQKECGEEMAKRVAKLRELGQGIGSFERIIQFIETHDGRFMRSKFMIDGKQLRVDEMTPEQQYEANLYAAWRRQPERKILEECVEKTIEEVQQEYGDKVAKRIEKLRKFGFGIEREKTLYEQVIEFIKLHDGKLMRGFIKMNGRMLTSQEMSSEQRYERNLYARWIESEERRVLLLYAGRTIEEIQIECGKDMAEKIAELRKYGLGEKEKTVYEQVIEFLKAHDGKVMQGSFRENGRQLRVDEMTPEQHEEVKLHWKWGDLEEKRILVEYKGREIEEVQEKYGEEMAKKIAELRSLIKKGRLQPAKEDRDRARARNDRAKEHERQVIEKIEEQTKKRGAGYGE